MESCPTIQLKCVLGLAALSLLTSCDRHTAIRNERVTSNQLASVNGIPITDFQFQELLSKRARHQQEHFTLNQKEALLDELIRAEAVYAKALAAGYDTRPEVSAVIKRLIIQGFQEEQLKVPSTNTFSEEELFAVYRGNAKDYATPAAVRGALIYVKVSPQATSEKKDEWRSAAETLWQQAQGGDAAFRELAQQCSDDQATRYRGGETGWITSHDGHDPHVIESLFAMDEPGFSPLVSTAHGFYILKLLEKRPASVRPFEEVCEKIRYDLMRKQETQRLQVFYEEMKSGLNIQVNRERLESISPKKNGASSSPQIPRFDNIPSLQ
jgi:parvulin-like peptidyl-prolyl isomerase